ncbi:MAG: hypothetical protein NTU44_13610 [Bacteroidetes bacterium]|nr:hypothetical protein [Bacteroidota bacterium]
MLGIIILAIIVLAIVLPFVFKKQIVEAVKKGINDNLTAKVEFTDYNLSLFRSFPNFSLGLDKLSVAGSGIFNKDTLLKTENIRVTIDLFSVLKGERYVIKKISLNKPSILLKTLKDGKVNWDITKPSAGSAAPPSNEPSNFKLSIHQFSIIEGRLVYDDESMGVVTRLAGIDMTVGADINGDISQLRTKTNASSVEFSYGGISCLKNAMIDLSSDIEADMKNFKFTFSKTSMKLNELFLGMDGWFAMPGDDMAMDLKFDAKKNEFKNFLSLVPAIFAKDFDKVETRGTLAFSGFVKGIYNDKSIPSFGLNLQVGNAMFHYPQLPGSVSNINIDVNIGNKNGKPDNTVIDIRKFHVEMAGNTADMRMLITTPVSDPAIKGTIACRVNLAEVKNYYPLDPSQELNGTVTAAVALNGRMSSIDNKKYEDFQANGDVAVTGMHYKSKDFPQGLTISNLKLLFSPQYVDMPVCDLRFGRSDLKANGKLLNILAFVLRNEKLTGSFESSSTLIDLNEFMQKETTAKTPADTTPMSVIRVPGNIDFTARTRIAKLLYDKMDITNVMGTVRIADQKVNLDNLQMNLLGGSMGVTGSYNSQPLKPLVDFNLDITRIDIPQSYKTFVTVRKFAPVAEKCSGKVSMKMKFNTILDTTMMPVYESLNGNGILKTENLEIRGFALTDKLAETLKIDKFKTMTVGNTTMEISILNGKLVVKPFSYTTDKIKTTLSGWNSLDQTISYDAVMEIPRELFGGQANAILDNMVKKAGTQGLSLNPGSTVVVAAKITGTFIKPVITTDLKKNVNSALNEVKQQAIQKVEEKVKQEVTKVKEDVGARAQKILDDANTKAQQIRDEAKKAGDLLISQAQKEGQGLVDKASNPIAKAAARETSKQMVNQARKKAEKLQQEADNKANQVLDNAKKEVDQLKK